MQYASDASPLLLQERNRVSKLRFCFRFPDLSTTFLATGVDVATELTLRLFVDELIVQARKENPRAYIPRAQHWLLMLEGKEMNLKLWNPDDAAGRTISVEDDGISVPSLESPSTLILRPGYAVTDAKTKKLEGPCEILSNHILVVVTKVTTSYTGKKKKTNKQDTRILTMLVPPALSLGSILSQNGASIGFIQEQDSSSTTLPSEIETGKPFLLGDNRAISTLGWAHGKRIAVRVDTGLDGV